MDSPNKTSVEQRANFPCLGCILDAPRKEYDPVAYFITNLLLLGGPKGLGVMVIKEPSGYIPFRVKWDDIEDNRWLVLAFTDPECQQEFNRHGTPCFLKVVSFLSLYIRRRCPLGTRFDLQCNPEFLYIQHPSISHISPKLIRMALSVDRGFTKQMAYDILEDAFNWANISVWVNGFIKPMPSAVLCKCHSRMHTKHTLYQWIPGHIKEKYKQNMA